MPVASSTTTSGPGKEGQSEFGMSATAASKASRIEHWPSGSTWSATVVTVKTSPASGLTNVAESSVAATQDSWRTTASLMPPPVYTAPPWAPRRRDRPGPASSAHAAAAIADGVGEDELAELVGGGEVGAAAVDLGELLDELGEHRVGRQHEGGDDDALAAAQVGLFEGEVDDPQVEAEGVLVDAVALGDRRGLAVGDEEDLLVGMLLASQEAAAELQ